MHKGLIPTKFEQVQWCAVLSGPTLFAQACLSAYLVLSMVI